MKKIAEAFGKILKEERKKAKLSQEELAFKTSLDRTYISLLERGLRQPSLTTIFEISKQLKIKPDSLIVKVEECLRD